MATPESALSNIQSIATDFSETYLLACKIYVRVPGSREQFKIVDQDYSIMSSTFDKNLYLTKSDVEYYSNVPIWVLSPNDFWGVVRKFTRNEDIEIDASTGIIMDPSKKPWLKVAVGHPGNLTVFTSIIQYLSMSLVMYSQTSANYFESYKQNINNHVINYEFQGNEHERTYIRKLLSSAITGYSRAGPMAPSIPEVMLRYFGNDNVLLFDYYDVLEVRAGIVVDEVFLLGPENAYSRMVTINVNNKDGTVNNNGLKVLNEFGQSANGRYAISLKSSGPWFYVHPKMIPALKEIITMYDTIHKQNTDGNGGQDVKFTCEEHIAHAMNLMTYLSLDNIENNNRLYSLAVQLLKIRTDLLDPTNCLISVANDPIDGNQPRLGCKLDKTILDDFKARNRGITELYIFPVNQTGQVINEAITHINSIDNMKVNGVDLKKNTDEYVKTGYYNWLVLYDNADVARVMAKALYDSVQKILVTANGVVNRA
tara:strand:- start:1874 stop:3322 length:1449 start_codon:yes stop_codon:yes gene_type:complete